MTSQARGNKGAIDYRPALYSIRNELQTLIMVNLKRNNILSDFARVNAAVEAIAAGIADVAAAIRNPAANNDQAALDELAGTLEAFSATLGVLKVEEDAEDGGAAPEAPAE